MTSRYQLSSDFQLETVRCRLRHVCSDDIPHVFSATRTPGFNDGMLWDAPDRIEDLAIPHENNGKGWREGTMFVFTIEEKVSGAFIGRIVLVPDSEALWKLGFWTHPDRQGQGYATEAAKAVLTLAFDHFQAEAVEAYHAIWNMASARVLEKVEMRFVRYVPEGFQKKGRWVEENLLRITRSEWEQGGGGSASEKSTGRTAL